MASTGIKTCKSFTNRQYWNEAAKNDFVLVFNQTFKGEIRKA